MKVIIGGDFVISDSNVDDFKKADIKNVFSDELLDIWFNHDFRAFNLEQPIISDNRKKIQKSGPHLSAPSSSLKGVLLLKPSLVFLSNNHILDYGEEGLLSTTKLLKDKDISFIGVGKNIEDASNNSVFSFLDTAFINCCEHEFSVSGRNHPGANAYNVKDVFLKIKKFKEQGKYVIVIYHGGKEEYQYPTPFLKKRCELMAEFGADLILCQHSHCIGSLQKYLNCTIVYGQGNFLFKDYKDNELWRYGLLVSVETSNQDIDYIPIKSSHKIELVSGEEKEKLLREFETRSNKIIDSFFVEDEYKKFANRNKYRYLCRLFGYSKARAFIEIKVFKGYFLNKKLMGKKGMVLKNIIECEPHIEIIKEIIDSEYQKNYK